MRTEHNPLRGSQAPNTIKPIVFVVVTHLPCNDSQYHFQRMEVIQTCLTTMRQNSYRDHTFLVWDNGSKDEFRDWLQHIFEPDILVLSSNIGKTAARTSAINTLPLSSIVCYSDDDILYYDNWLNPQIELLNHFPNVACVSSYPVRTMFRWGNIHTLEWARKNARLEQGQFIPREWEDDFADSIGRSHQDQIAMTIKDFDYRITYEGKQAYATSHHCQFIGYAVNIRNALVYDDMAMGDEKPVDIALDNIGLRLCTTQRLSRHMGNVIDDKLRSEIANMYIKEIA